MKGKKRWILIGLGIPVLVVIVLVVALIVGSQGKILTGGVPLGNVSFTNGDIPGVPVYPGVTQSTDNKGVSVPDDMRRVIGDKEDDWKRYLTDDSPNEVLTWYDQAITDAGFNRAGPRESGIVIFSTADTRYALYLTEVQGKTNIILATGKE